MLEGVLLGPINNDHQWRRIAALVDEAIAHGARLASGGKRIDRSGYFFEPTILGQNG
jgi:succinate-semialdehyde dehydrogenase/glutarate-semialdehyde dehydrogenase